MGFFGKDDRPPHDTPPAPTPAVRPHATKPQPTAERATVIAQPSRIEGTLFAGDEVRIEGEVHGSVQGSGTVIVAQGGTVAATIRARRIVIAGKVIGDVSAEEKIELAPTADLQGNITAPKILIQEGATFEGQVLMHQPAEGDQQAQAKKDAKGPSDGQSEGATKKMFDDDGGQTGADADDAGEEKPGHNGPDKGGPGRDRPGKGRK
jgi:cytoskeletal protein CcmA (bactofilin family)